MKRHEGMAPLLAAAVVLAWAGSGEPAERGPVRIGLLVPLTGGAAQIGADMRNGFMMAIEQAAAQAGGRRIEVVVEDDEANPATSLTKARKVVEADQVNVVVGTLLASSCYSTAPYLTAKRIPFFPLCAADDLTQRRPTDVMVRLTSTSSQDYHPFGEYVAKVLGYKRVATLGADYAYGWELIAGFQRTYEENGGQVVQKLWYPLNAQDFAPYLAQIRRDVNAVFLFSFGGLALRSLKQYQGYGLKEKLPLIGAGQITDESVLPSMGDEALGIITPLHYSAALDAPGNKRFVQTYRPKFGKVPSFYSVDLNVMAQVIIETLKAVNGNVENVPDFLSAARKIKLADTPRGPVEIDETGNAVHNVYIRKTERVGGELQNTVIQTYPHVSQFWKYAKEEYLRLPMYDRNNPPCRFCQ